MKRFFRAALAAALVALSFRPGASADAPLRLVHTIPLPGVEGRLDHFAADVKGQRLFVAALGNDTLEVLDLKSGKRLRSVRGLREPQGVAFAPDVGRVLVGTGAGASCSVLDARTFSVLASVPSLDDADNVRYDAGAKQVFVGYGRGALAVLDAVSGKLLGSIRLPDHPESFQLEQRGPRVFVNVPGAGRIVVVDRAKREVVASWPLRGAGANFPMALDESNHRLFTGCRRPPRLLVYDTETGKEVASTEIVGDTDDVFYDAARKRLYVIGGGGGITVLDQRDPDHYSRMTTEGTGPGARTGLFIPEWGRLVVAVPHRGSQQAEVRVFAVR